MNLRRVIETTEQLTHLSLPERTALIEEIARVIPAGNVPSMVAAGLANLPGRSVPIQETRRKLKLAGKDIDSAFPEGTWQFYVEFSLREDSGRHACETVGFQQTLAFEEMEL